MIKRIMWLSLYRVFEHIAIYCERFTNLIPLSFVLGFYVAVVVGRWWNQFINIPWHDRFVTSHLSLCFFGLFLEKTSV